MFLAARVFLLACLFMKTLYGFGSGNLITFTFLWEYGVWSVFMQPQALQLVEHHPLKQSQRVELGPHSHSGDGLFGT